MMSVLKDHFLRTFHRIVFVAYIFTIYYENKYVEAPAGSKYAIERKQLGGRFKYLTYLNAVFVQAVFFGLSTINDAFTRTGRRGKPTLLQRFMDFFFTGIAFPVGCFVSASFWGLYLTDRELIMPLSYDSWYPQWLSHLFHTMPIVSLILEVLLVEHKYQKGFVLRWMPLFVMYSAYVAWIYYVAEVGKFWIYPVFGVLEPMQRIGFVVFLLTPFILFFLFGEKLTNLVWGRGSSKSKGSSNDSGKQKSKNKQKTSPKAKGTPKKNAQSSAQSSPKKTEQSPKKDSPKKKNQSSTPNTPNKKGQSTSPKKGADQSPAKSTQKKNVQSPKKKSKKD